jgi:hypothetical protein
MANYIEARLAQFRADAEKQIQFHANCRLSMTDQQRPITPPPWLVQEWWEQADQYQDDPRTYFDYVATEAAQWGADQELEACCEWLHWQNLATHPELIPSLRADRRPKPPSLKEQALALVEQHEDGWRPSPKDWDTIRRALEALPDSIVVFPSQC